MNTLYHAYEIENWGGRSVFPGDFLNFGYWKNIDTNKTLTDDLRIESAMSLYDITTSELSELKQGNVLEVGFGKGGGLLFLSRKYPNLNFYGIDAVKKHLNLLKEKMQENLIENLVEYDYSSFEDTTFALKFDAIVSIEALQHVKNLSAFLRKLMQSLKKKGVFMACAHLANGAKEQKECLEIIPFVKQGIDILIPIDQVVNLAASYGFYVEFTSIGNDIFHGYQRWIEAKEVHGNSNCIYAAYKKKLIDYYIIKLYKM